MSESWNPEAGLAQGGNRFGLEREMVEADSNAGEAIDGADFYLEGDRVVFTRACHLRRGFCCGSGCRHCPFVPRWTKGTTVPAPVWFERVTGDTGERRHSE
ncbi:MAG: hypothetical protein EBZ36_04020 [Acidobacteria bacterium]|nr:hypothetical protein [Acidobacteriota bacterium]